MSVAVAELVGQQTPTTLWVPPGAVSTAAVEVLELCDSIGLVLDPWERLVLEYGLSEAANGNWLAFEVACIVARQNGKGTIIEALELGCLFLFGDMFIAHSAHEFKTAKEGFLRLNGWLENVDWMRRRVRQTFRSNETVGFDLKSGQRIRFMARSSGSGRGFTGHKTILDEALILGDTQMSAVMPTMATAPNPQIWYFSSAGPPIGKPKEVAEVLARLWRRGHGGGDPQLVFAAWEAVLHDRDCDPDCDRHDHPGDRRTWAKTNPGLGYRMTEEAIAREWLSMGAEAFARERLSVGDYPASDSGQWLVIPEAKWTTRGHAEHRPDGPVAFGISAQWPAAEWGSIAVAGRRGTDVLVQLVDRRPGTSWIPERMRELQDRHSPCATVLDDKDPAVCVKAALVEAGVRLTPLSMVEAGQAFATFVAAVAGDAPYLRHYDQDELTEAVRGGQTRPVGDARTWARKGATDISPVQAGTNALHGLLTKGRAAGLWGFYE